MIFTLIITIFQDQPLWTQYVDFMILTMMLFLGGYHDTSSLMRPSRSAVLLFGPLGQRLADSIIPSPNTFHDVDNHFKRSDYTIPCPFNCSVENLTLGAASTGVWGRSSCAIYLHPHQTKSVRKLISRSDVLWLVFVLTRLRIQRVRCRARFSEGLEGAHDGRVPVLHVL